MAVYRFACPDCGSVEASFPMGSAPGDVACPECGGRAGRVFTAPNFSIANRAAYKLIDSTEKSAHEPRVVTSLPSTGAKAPARYTANPKHLKLPRP